MSSAEHTTPVNTSTRTISQVALQKIPLYWQLGILNTNTHMPTDGHRLCQILTAVV